MRPGLDRQRQQFSTHLAGLTRPAPCSPCRHGELTRVESVVLVRSRHSVHPLGVLGGSENVRYGRTHVAY